MTGSAIDDGDDEGLAIGVDVGGTKILVVAIDPAAPRDVLADDTAATPDAPDDLITAIEDTIESVVAAAGRPLGSIGVGMPGFIDRAGVAQAAPNLRAAVGVDVGAAVRARFGVPVTIDNDANCAAWCARQLDAPGADTLVAVTFGTGIGGGIVIGGRLHRGANGYAGEPGHMVVCADGDACVCGQRGCWEVYASGTGLGGLAREAVTTGTVPALLAAADGDPLRIDGPLVADVARQGDPGAMAVMDSYADWVAIGLVNLVNLLDPDVIVLGGGVVADEDLFLPRVRDAVDRASLSVIGRQTPIVVSSVGPRAGAIGAALLAREPSEGHR
jgi:glucokinase